MVKRIRPWPPPPPPPEPPPIEVRRDGSTRSRPLPELSESGTPMCPPDLQLGALIKTNAPKLITGALFGLAAFLLTVAMATGGRAW